MSGPQLMTEFITNQGGGWSPDGPMGEALCHVGMDIERMRPYFDNHRFDEEGNSNPFFGRPCFNMRVGQEWDPKQRRMVPVYEQTRLKQYDPVFNATTLTKDEWKIIDDRVVMVARQRLKAWQDLVSANSISIDGYGHSLFEYDTTSDPGEVTVDMDGDGGPRDDQETYTREAVPLPITYCAYTLKDRQMVISRNKGQGTDVRKAEAAGRRIGEHLEKTYIGTVTGLSYGVTADYSRAASVYGLTNYPDRVTKTDMTTPTGSNGTTVYNDFIEMREAMYAQNFFGPFMVYYSTPYDTYLDTHLSTSEVSAGTVRKAIEGIQGIAGLQRLDYLTSGYQVIFVQMTSDVARAVLGMPLKTVQWDTMGGVRHNFRTMTIQLPQLFSDDNGQCGIGHGTTS